MSLEDQLLKAQAKGSMRIIIDELPEDCQAMLLVWYPQGAKRTVQYGMNQIAFITHFLHGFLLDFLTGKIT